MDAPSNVSQVHLVECITYTRKPFGRGHSIVSCESKKLPRRRSIGADCYNNQQNKDYESEPCCPRYGTGRVLKHINERIARWRSDSVRDISNAKQVGDQKAESHWYVEEETPDHAPWDYQSSIRDLLC